MERRIKKERSRPTRQSRETTLEARGKSSLTNNDYKEERESSMKENGGEKNPIKDRGRDEEDQGN